MAAVDFSAHVTNPLAAGPASAAASAAGGTNSDDSDFSFEDLLDVVNPLQHFPVVSTLYRAITGDQIKTIPKIAGDTLYGGLIGFVSSVADTIFEKITGKSVGDTVLAWIEGESATPAMAATTPPTAATPALAAPATVVPASLDSIVIPGQDALLMALSRQNVDQDIALRAASAYRNTLAVSDGADSSALH